MYENAISMTDEQRNEWIRENGSDRLRGCLEEGIECDAIFLDEWLLKERPGWVWGDRFDDGRWQKARNARSEDLAFLKEAREIERYPVAEFFGRHAAYIGSGIRKMDGDLWTILFYLKGNLVKKEQYIEQANAIERMSEISLEVMNSAKGKAKHVNENGPYPWILIESDCKYVVEIRHKARFDGGSPIPIEVMTNDPIIDGCDWISFCVVALTEK